MMRRAITWLVASGAAMALVACSAEPSAVVTKPDANALQKAKDNPTPPKGNAAVSGGMPPATKSGLDVNGS